MDGLVKELKRETAIAIKKFKWTNEEAKRHYNHSVFLLLYLFPICYLIREYLGKETMG
jgi:hypothetical protein